MSLLLTPAEAVLLRTGPNNISALFEARGGFDPERALFGLHQMVDGTERFHRIPGGRVRPCFGARMPLHWPDHVALLDAPGLTAAQMMALARRLALPRDRPFWRAVMVNPDGGGWSGLALQFDHAIADGTRMSRHITSGVRPGPQERLPLDGLPHLALAQLSAQTDRRLTPPDPALIRLTFDGLARALPDAEGHADALLRLSHRALCDLEAFATLAPKRRDTGAVARIESLKSTGGALGNRARMVSVDLSRHNGGASGLFQPSRMPLTETLRMLAAQAIPGVLLRPIVQREFSQPGVVLTVVPVARTLPPLFGISLAAIHPAAPVLGRPPLAVTAVRTGDGFDVCVTAHTPEGRAVAGLSAVAAEYMMDAVQ